MSARRPEPSDNRPDLLDRTIEEVDLRIVESGCGPVLPSVILPTKSMCGFGRKSPPQIFSCVALIGRKVDVGVIGRVFSEGHVGLPLSCEQ